jgi:hypothetical protein
MTAGLGIADWLRQLDLAQYESVFRDNAVDLETLPELGEIDLEKLGVLLGHRKKMLQGHRAANRGGAPAGAPPAGTLLAMPRSEAAERRQLTILFCDIVNSTVLATQRDPEDLREILAAYTARTSEVIERFGGNRALRRLHRPLYRRRDHSLFWISAGAGARGRRRDAEPRLPPAGAG